MSCLPWPRSSVIGAFVYAPFNPDWWLPNNPSEPHHTISTFGREIDSLFIIVLVITGITFIGTQVALVWAAFRFVERTDAEGRPVRQATYFHGSQRLEVVWTIIPASILGVHRALPDGDLGRHQVPQRGP